MTVYPRYTPVSLGRELGIMFGFLGACLVTMAVYSFAWRAHQRRLNAQDLAHRRAFQSRTGADHFHRGGTDAHGFTLGTTVAVTGGGGDLHEKMLDRYAMPVNRAEMPVHGDMTAEGETKRSFQSRNANGLL